MNCPSCKTPVLRPRQLEENLEAFNCPQCNGHWIQGLEYWKWLELHGENLPERENAEGEIVVSETKEIKNCPECKRFMVKYLVGHGVAFSLDQCSACKGLWFDTNEWEALVGRNLHDDIHAVMTAPWQAEAVKQQTRRRLEQIYTAKYGAEDYAEIKRIRRWLDAHPRKYELLAYLTDADPLAV